MSTDAPAIELPRSTPSAEGVDARGIIDFLTAQAGEDLEVHSITVVRHGRVICEGHAAPYTADSRPLVYSLSKTFTSAAVGVAVGEGLFGYDDLLIDHFPDLVGADDGAAPSEVARTIRVRDALAMATGHTQDMYPFDNELHRSRLRSLFVPGPDGVPGETFAYNQLATYAVTRILEQTSGMTLPDYLNQRILTPLGCAEPGWGRDADGLALGFSGFHARTSTIASFFQLLADGGRRDGHQLLAPEWVDQHCRVQVQTAGPDADRSASDWAQGYGWQCWRSRHGYRGDGAFGQYALVLPDDDAVIVLTGEHEDMQALLDLVWQHVLPALRRPGTRADDDALLEQLAGWWLDPVPGADLPTTLDGDDGLGGHLHVERDQLTWTEADGVQHTVVVGRDDWALGRWTWPDGRGVDVACSGAVVSDAGPGGTDVVRIRVQVTSSPHSFTWTLPLPGAVGPDAGTSFSWRFVPLRDTGVRGLAV